MQKKPAAQPVKATPGKPSAPKTKPAEKSATKTKAPPASTTAKKTPPSSQAKRSPKSKEKPAIPNELVQQLQESIAKIEKKPDKYAIEEPFVLPERLAPSSRSDAAPAAQDSRAFLAGVKEELMQQLHLALHLPDFGEVKIQLELSESGRVQTIKVLKAASQKNREYLERELPRMSFSFISMHRLSAKERTFVISFHNEM